MSITTSRHKGKNPEKKERRRRKKKKKRKEAYIVGAIQIHLVVGLRRPDPTLPTGLKIIYRQAFHDEIPIRHPLQRR